MADQWHYRLFGEEFGPVSGEMLRSLIDLGTLSEADEVREEGTSSWISAGRALAASGSQAVATADETDEPEEEEARWYCRVAGQELGPLTFDDLLRFAENGELTADEEVKYGENAKWRRVGSIGRLVAVLPYHETSALRPAQAKAQPAPSKTAAAPTPAETAAPQPIAEPAGPTYHPSAEQPNWSAWIRGAEFGPASLVQLSQWLATGQLGPTDFVRQGPTGAWLPSATVTQLLAQLTLPAAAPTVPNPEPIPKPRPVAAVAPAAQTRVPSAEPASSPKRLEESAPVAAPAVDKAEPPKPKPAQQPPEIRETVKPVIAEVPEPKPATPAVAPQKAWTPPAPARPIPRPAQKARTPTDWGAMFGPLKEPKTLGAIAIILVAVVVVFGKNLLPSGSGADRKKVVALRELLTEFRKLRDSKAAPGEWTTFEEKAGWWRRT